MHRKIFAEQRVRIERDQRAGGVSVDRKQLRVFQSLERHVALRLAEADERFGQPGDGLPGPQGIQAVSTRGPVE